MTHCPVSPLRSAVKRRHNSRRFSEAISMTAKAAFCLLGRARHLKESSYGNFGRNSSTRSATMRIRATLARKQCPILRSERI